MIKAHYVMKYAPRNVSVKFPLLTSIKIHNFQKFLNHLEFFTEEEYNILRSSKEKIGRKANCVMKYEARNFQSDFPY